MDKYLLQEEIGHGAFGTVYHALHKPTSVRVAIKIIDTSNFTNYKQSMRFLHNEMEIAPKITHPLFAQTYEVIEYDTNVAFVMELVEGGSFLDYLNITGRLSEKECRKFFRQLIYAISFLHNEINAVHRDIKAENILINRFGDIKLVDFGFARIHDPKMRTLCGSPPYAAPELIQGKAYNPTVDVWAAGIILFAMAHFHLPFSGDNFKALAYSIIHKDPVIDISLSDELQDIILRLLAKDPDTRITIPEIMQHPWFAGGEPYNADCMLNWPQYETTIANELTEYLERSGQHQNDELSFKILLRAKTSASFSFIYPNANYQHHGKLETHRSMPIVSKMRRQSMRIAIPTPKNDILMNSPISPLVRKATTNDVRGYRLPAGFVSPHRRHSNTPHSPIINTFI